jgi:tellurite resistance protein
VGGWLVGGRGVLLVGWVLAAVTGTGTATTTTATTTTTTATGGVRGRTDSAAAAAAAVGHRERDVCLQHVADVAVAVAQHGGLYEFEQGDPPEVVLEEGGVGWVGRVG